MVWFLSLATSCMCQIFVRIFTVGISEGTVRLVTRISLPIHGPGFFSAYSWGRSCCCPGWLLSGYIAWWLFVAGQRSHSHPVRVHRHRLSPHVFAVNEGAGFSTRNFFLFFVRFQRPNSIPKAIKTFQAKEATAWMVHGDRLLLVRAGYRVIGSRSMNVATLTTSFAHCRHRIVRPKIFRRTRMR